MSALIPASDSVTLAALVPACCERMAFGGRWDLRTPGRAITVNSGSYVRVRLRGTSVSAVFDTASNQAPFPTIAWKIDDGAWREEHVSSRVLLAAKLTNDPHSLWLMIRGLDEHQNRWTQPLVASVTFMGLELSEGELLPAFQSWKCPKLKIEFLGDSITEGVLVSPKADAAWSWQSNALLSYSSQTALALDAEWRQVGFGATGLAHGGSGGAVGALESFDFFYEGCPRDDWQPDLVIVNQGTNDRDMPSEHYRELYLKYLAMIRQAYPQARIIALRPFAGCQEVGIRGAVDALQAQGDKQVYYVDTTGWYDGDIHPNFTGSTEIARRLTAELKALIPLH